MRFVPPMRPPIAPGTPFPILLEIALVVSVKFFVSPAMILTGTGILAIWKLVLFVVFVVIALTDGAVIEGTSGVAVCCVMSGGCSIGGCTFVSVLMRSPLSLVKSDTTMAL